MAGESFGKVAVELEEEGEEVVAYFAFGEGAGWRGLRV